MLTLAKKRGEVL